MGTSRLITQAQAEQSEAVTHNFTLHAGELACVLAAIETFSEMLASVGTPLTQGDTETDWLESAYNKLVVHAGGPVDGLTIDRTAAEDRETKVRGN
jgi:hypothetical protein